MRAFLYDASTAVVGAIVGMVAAAVCLTAMILVRAFWREMR